ncbi:hypothetical protein C0991_010312, partial [Blastosporella zonata]
YGKTNTFMWSDSYSIAATSEGFRRGEIVPPGNLTDIEEIFTRESALLGPTWNNFEVKDDPEAPRDGFGFNVGDALEKGAAAIVYLGGASVDGNDALQAHSPFFISHYVHKGPSFTTLVPFERVMVCFERGATFGTMTTHVSEEDTIIELSREEPKQTWKLFNDGHWEKLDLNDPDY